MAEITLEYAKKLYDKGEFLEAVKASNACAETRENLKECLLLNAMCLMRTLPDETSNIEPITKSLIGAVEEAEGIEEAYDIFSEFKSAVAEWKREQTIRNLKALQLDPTLENFQIFNKKPVAILMQTMQIELALKTAPCFKGRAEAAGISMKDATATYEKNAPNAFTSQEENTLMYETAVAIYEQAKILVESNSRGNGEQMLPIMHKLLEQMMVAELLTGRSAGQSDKNMDKQVTLSRLYKKMEMMHYRVNAKIYPNGQERLFYYNTSATAYDDLSKLYNDIQSLDPSFVRPQLPTVPTQKSSGGCYVATAVYGSYDCPQVWTLRRFRDDTLAKSLFGRAFIRTYYAISPTIVKWFGETQWFKKMWQGVLDRMVNRLNGQGVEDTPYNDRPW